MKKIILILFLALPGALAFGQGQVAPERPAKRIVTRTRLVAIFSDLEDQLCKALQEKDQQSIGALLGEDFQVWNPAPPGDPVPHDDWERQALSENLNAFRIRQMAVNAVDERAALVHFVLTKTTELSGKASSHDYFIVDLWQRNDDKWQLSNRYASPLPTTSVRPAAVRPSGKN